MNAYNVVTNFRINEIIKSRSKYYKVSLGLAITTEANSGDRTYNKSDEFAFFYNSFYKASILKQGSIGNIKFYTDHYIKEDKIAFYLKEEEFVFDFDQNKVNEKGIDFYLGHLIKTIETEYEERIKKDLEIKERKSNTTADPNKVFTNPGNVSYDDLKAYLEKERLERLKS